MHLQPPHVSAKTRQSEGALHGAVAASLGGGSAPPSGCVGSPESVGDASAVDVSEVASVEEVESCAASVDASASDDGDGSEEPQAARAKARAKGKKGRMGGHSRRNARAVLRGSSVRDGVALWGDEQCAGDVRCWLSSTRAQPLSDGNRMSHSNGKLELKRETLKSIRVSAGLRTGHISHFSMIGVCDPDHTKGGGVKGDDDGGGNSDPGAGVPPIDPGGSISMPLLP
jgi:hypothetical protein